MTKLTTFIFLWLILPIILVFSFSSFVFAQSKSTANTEIPSQSQRINELSDLIDQKTVQLNNQRKLIITSGQNIEDSEKEKLKNISEDLDRLNESFLFALFGNQVDIYALDDVVVPDTTWQQDIVDVLKPLADTLKTVTRRPREVASLREAIADANIKSKNILNALDVANKITRNSLSAEAEQKLLEHIREWNKELEQTKEDKLLAESQLNSLDADSTSSWSSFWSSTKMFFLGRGLTLAIAMVAATLTFLLMRYLWWIYSTKIASKETRRKSTLYRFSAYSYYILTGLVVVLAVLFTLWIREDLLLLAIAFVALASLALGFRQYLPNYIAEARLLLNLGNVREDERVVYEGLPWQIMSLNIQTVLRNPAIDGVIRLPLRSIATLSSRPIKNNLWFPTKKGDYVVLPDGLFGQVKCQTPDLVEISVKGGITVTYPTSEFFSLKVLNLSGDETFGVSTTFGLDYNLQSVSLTVVPETLRAAIHSALIKSGYQEHVKSELVELSSANESSLDYLIFITLSREVASDYFAIERLLVQTCIDVSNTSNWSIPFPQLTVHNAVSPQV